MNTVLSGVALAAILALTAPAWAQAPSAQPSQPESTNAAMPSANHMQGKTSHKAKPHAAAHHGAKNRHAANARSMHRTTTARRGGSGPTDNVANQLNRQEAQRLTGSSAPSMGNPNPAPMAAPNQSPTMQGQ